MKRELVDVHTYMVFYFLFFEIAEKHTPLALPEQNFNAFDSQKLTPTFGVFCASTFVKKKLLLCYKDSHCFRLFYICE